MNCDIFIITVSVNTYKTVFFYRYGHTVFYVFLKTNLNNRLFYVINLCVTNTANHAYEFLTKSYKISFYMSHKKHIKQKRPKRRFLLAERKGFEPLLRY